MMCVLSVICLLLCVSVHTAHSVLYYKTGTEGSPVNLYCKNAGSVMWSKGVPGGRRSILTVKPGGDTIKHNPDPDHRYSVLTSLELNIRNLSLSDSGIYYCNTDTVINLTVTTQGNSTENRSTPTSTMKTTIDVTPDVNKLTTCSTAAPAGTTSPSSTPSSSDTDSPGISTEIPNITATTEQSMGNSTGNTSTPTSTMKTTNITKSTETTQTTMTSKASVSQSSKPGSSDTRKSTETTQTTTTSKGSVSQSNKTPSDTTKSTETTQTTTTSKASVSQSSGPSKDSSVEIIVSVLVGVSVVTVLIAVLLWRCFFQKKTFKDRRTNPVYESIEDAKPAANENQYEGVYVLAGDPAIVNLEKKSHTEPSSSSDAQSPENEGEPVYHTIQNDAVTQS